MKTAIMVAIVLAAVAVSGCNNSYQGGSMSADEGFTITAPTFNTDVKQGDRQTVTISLQRDKYFKQNVTLLATATSGITVEPSKIVVKASESPDVQFQIKAPKDAALSEYLVHIVATPETGNSTSKDFTVKVVRP